jgi:hypothetical protein
MTVLRLRRRLSRKKKDETSIIFYDIESFPRETGAKLFRYIHFYGFYDNRETYAVYEPDKTGKQVRKYKHRRIKVPVDIGFFNLKEACDWLDALPKKSNLKKPFILGAFNLRYDYWFLHSIISEHRTIMAEGRFITAKLKNGIKMIDMVNHSGGMPLSAWIDAYNMGNAETNYCKEHIEKTEWRDDMNDEEIAEHCRWDAMASWEMGMKKRDFYWGLGLSLKLTTGSSSLDYLLTNHFMKDDGDYYNFNRDDDDEVNLFVHRGYHGGRTELLFGRKHFVEICSLDVNSMYPAVMVENLYPDPRDGKWGAKTDDWKSIMEKYQGFFEVDVFVPKMNIPVLAMLTDKLIYPTGYLHGVWSAEELRYAEECGCKILKCDRFYWYKTSIPLFRNFEQEIFNERKKAEKLYGKHSAPAIDLKLLGNAGYGKFGETHREVTYTGTVSGMRTTEKGDRENPVDEVWLDLVRIGDEREKTLDGEQVCTFSWGKELYAGHAFVEFAAMTTAFARIKLTRAARGLESAGYIIVYMDTDSIKFTTKSGKVYEVDLDTVSQILTINKDILGAFKNEGIHEHLFLSPKTYLTKDERGSFDNSESKHKGVPRKVINTTYIYGENGEMDAIVSTFNHFTSLKEGIRSGITPGHVYPTTKTDHLIESKRIWDADNLYSLPIDLPSPEPGEIAIAQVINKQELNMEMGR